MAKRLSEILAERAAEKPPNQKARNRAAFIAQISEIKEALDEGWSVKDIWEALSEEGRITFGYQAFLGYVKRLIRSQPAGQDKPVEEAGQAKQAPEPAERTKSEGIKGFEWNPNPKKEDLF